MSVFFSESVGNNKFHLFSIYHFYALAVFLIGIILLFIFRKSLQKERANKNLRYVLAIVSIVLEITYHVWLLVTDRWNAADNLPLQLCSISLWLGIVLLFTKRFAIFEIVYFTGIGGALQALLTPEMSFNFPHYRYFHFFITHSIIVWLCLFFVLVEGYRPKLISLFKTFLFLNILVGVIIFVNKWTGGNYMFLSYKPKNGSLLDFLGPYPWYILSLEGVCFIIFFILYLPFAFKKKKQ